MDIIDSEFDDFEQSIDNAFKIKKEEKKTPLNTYTSHDYFINDGLNKMLFFNEIGIKRDILKCRCGNFLELFFEQNEQFTYMSESNKSPQDFASYKVDSVFCPICGSQFRVIGKIIKIILNKRFINNGNLNIWEK